MFTYEVTGILFMIVNMFLKKFGDFFKMFFKCEEKIFSYNNNRQDFSWWKDLFISWWLTI